MPLIKLSLKEKIEILSMLHHRVENEFPLFMDTATAEERIRVHLLAVIDSQLEFANDLDTQQVPAHDPGGEAMRELPA